jgi:hypothetical protein
VRSIKFDELPQKADLRRPTVQVAAGPSPAPPATVTPTTATTLPPLTLDRKAPRK